jgi:hypothetical protein
MARESRAFLEFLDTPVVAPSLSIYSKNQNAILDEIAYLSSHVKSVDNIETVVHI